MQLQIFRCEYRTWSKHRNQENKKDRGGGGDTLERDYQDMGDIHRGIRENVFSPIVGREQYRKRGRKEE